MGTQLLAASGTLAAASKSSSSSYTFLLIILVIFGLLYFVMIRPQRNRQRQAQQTQRQVSIGSKVRTTAGMYGTIVDGDDNNVLVEVAPGVRIKMMRRAIMGVVPDDEPDGFQQTVPDVSDDTTSTASSSSNSSDRGDLNI